jgi:hypothetical protein
MLMSYKYPEDEFYSLVWNLDILDYTHFIGIIICRSLIIGVKYALMSDDHFQLLRNHIFS